MKKIYSILILSVAFVGLIGCVREDFETNPVKSGNVIKFAATTSATASKTSYGQLTDGAWPIYWENGDVVKIFCPEASEDGANNATYTVSGAGDNIVNYRLSGANTMMWGEEETHHFYNFYPAENIHSREVSTDGIYVVSVPREQNAILQDDGTYADMSAAAMAGHLAKKKSEVGDNDVIKLPFKPITTAFDIKITAPDAPADGTTSKFTKITITSITIANNATTTTGRKYLAGVFNYAPESGEFSPYTNTTTTDEVGSYTVNVKVPNIELEVGSNKSVTITAFLLPFDLPGDLRIIVNCKEEVSAGATGTISKTIKASEEQVANNIGKKIPVTLGKLPNPIEFNYKSWMANLDDDCYVSQISLPGTHDAGAYADAASGFIESLAITQVYDIPTQFDKGIRVLDFRPECSSTNANDPFDIAHGIISLDVTFEEVLADAVEWLAVHPTEFIIVQLKNESSTSLPLLSSTKYFTYWQRFMRDKLLKIDSDYVIDEFDPSMTIREVRGKLLFMSRDDYYSNSSYSEFGGWVGCKISGWNDNSALWNKTFYTAPNHENSTEGGVGMLWVSDLYKGGTLQNVSEANKNSAINNCMNDAKTNTNYSTWYMTWLNVSDNGIGTSNPGRRTEKYNDYVYTKLTNEQEYPSTTYYNAGIIMMDWAGHSTYKGDLVLKAIIDNNFKGSGPAKKTN